MDILILFSSSQLGGAERSLSRMVIASRRTQLDVHYRLASIRAEGPWSEWLREQSIEPLLFGNGNAYARNMVAALIRLFIYLHKYPIDIIYVSGLRVSLWLRLFKFLYPSVKIIHAVRWNPESDNRLDRLFRIIEKTTGFLIDGWIANSQAAKQTLIKQCSISTSNVEVIYNGIEEIAQNLPTYSERPLEVLTIANINPRKGFFEYISVIKKVIERVPHVGFVFIGRDDMNGALRQAIIDAGLEDHIRYEGFQSDITPWLRRARIFVLPSLWGEGCPTSILEAFSYAIPVVAYNIDGIPELVDDQKDGYLVAPNDLSFIEHIVGLLQNENQAETMGRRGRRKIKQKFTLTLCVKAHQEAFKLFCGR